MLLPPAGHHRFAQGVLRSPLRSGGQGIQLLLCPGRAQGTHRGHRRGPLGKRPSLIKGHLGDGGQPLQGVPLPHQKAVTGGVADGRHDGGGGGQHQGAGAKYHQNGYGPDDGASNQPSHKGSSEGNDHDPSGPPVRNPHNLCFPRIGGLNQADIALNRAVLPHPGGLHIEGSELIYRAAGHLVPRAFVHRQRLSGHHGLINGGLPRQDDAVHRNSLSREDPEPLPHLHLLGGNHLLPGAGDSPGSAGREVDQPLDPRPGPGHGELLQQAAQLHNKGHLPGGKDLSNGHRGNQGDGHQHISLDVKLCHQTDCRLQKNGNSAQQNGNPGRVEWKEGGIHQADGQRPAGDRQKYNIPFGAAPGCEKL